MTIARLALLLAAVSGAAVLAPRTAAAQGAPTVSGVEVTSQAGDDATYALGETIRVTVTFSEAVTVTGTPGLSIDMDPAYWGEKRAAYASGSGTAALVFTHQVVEPNLSTRGIAVLANSLALAGGTIRSASTQADASLTHVGLAHDADHKVDWRLSTDSGTAHDTTPPRVLRGEIDGATMRLTFSEALDEGSTGGRFWVSVKTSRTSARNFFATGPVAVDGNTVTVGLGEGNPRASAGLLTGNHALYVRRADDPAGGLRDLAGNAVRTPNWLLGDGGGRSSERIDLVNVTAAAPVVTVPTATGVAVTGVEVTSQAGADATYALGETIEVTLTFSEAVTVTGTPGLSIDMDPAAWGEKRAAYASGSGTAALVFTHKVVEPNLSRRGIAVLANSLALAGGSIRSASTQADAALTHVGLAHDASHKVDWRLAPPDATAPRLSSTVVEGRKLKLGFNEAIDDDASVANGAFTVKKTPQGGSEQNVGLSGTPAIEGPEVTLTLAKAVRSTDTDVKVSYRKTATDPGNGLRDEAGNEVASFANQPVANSTPDTTPPRLSVASVDGSTLTLTFDETLAAASLSNTAFAVKKTPSGGSETAVSLGAAAPAISAKKVTLTLASAVLATDTDVKVSYTKPGSGGKLADAASNEVASFTDEAVTNITGDTTPPTLVRGELDGGTVTLYFSEALDPDSTGGIFRVNLEHPKCDRSVRLRGHCWNTFDATGDVEISGNVVTVGLGEGNPRAQAGGTNNFWYTRPTGPAAKGLRDLAGNEVRSSRIIYLDNVTGPPLVSGVAVSSDAGDDRAYARGETIRVAVTFSEAVDVTGTPRVKLDFSSETGDEKWAAYASGSGTKVLGFAYTVAARDLSIDGVAVLANTLALNGGTIRSSSTAGDNAGLAHAGLAHDPNHRVDGTPSVSSVALSSDAGDDAAYGLGETIGVRLTFNEAVNVTGAPRVKLDFSSEAGDEKWAAYASGSGTKMLEFAYTVAQGDASSAGVAVLANTLALNGGTIRSSSSAGDNAKLAHAGLGHDPNHKVDSAPPTLSAAAVDGATLTLTFSETLGAAASLANGAFTVKKTPQGGTEENVSLSGTPAIAGATVTLTLASAVLSADTGVKVGYTRPTSDAGNRLKDEAGNAVASFTDQPVTNGTKASVSGVKVSSEAGDDGAYVLGETVRVTLTFSEAVNVTGAPQVKIDFSSGAGGERRAVYASGSGTTTLEFAYTVVARDLSTQGVAVLADTLVLDGGTIRSAASGKDAALAHAGRAHDPAHRVDGTPPPTLSMASVGGSTLTLTFNETLAAASLSNTAFAVKKTPSGGSETAVSLGAAAPAISAKTVTLTLASAVAADDGAIKVSYTKPGSGGKLADAAGNEVESFTDEPVTNITGDTTPPTLVRGEIDGGTMALYFSEPLDPDSTGGRFRLQVHAFNGLSTIYAAGEVAISGNKVTIGLGDGNPHAIAGGIHNFFLGYSTPTDPTARGLRDLAGNEVRNTRSVVLDNVTGPPRVTGVAVSSDAGDDRAYARGESIRVAVTFSKAVDVTGPPRLKIDFSSGAGGEKWAAYASGSGTKMLEFAYTVAARDLSTDGVAVLANTLELDGGTIRSASSAGENANLAHAGLAHDPNHRVDGTPSVSGVALSSDAGDDDTYGLGETIGVRLTFNEAVTVTGTPRVKLDFSSEAGDEKWAAYASGSGTKMLEFAYTVAQGDASSAGVAVLANTLALNGGTIRSSSSAGYNAKLAHVGLGHDPNHKVDSAPPTLSTAAVDGATLTLTFNEPLGAAASLANGAFTVKKTPQGGTEENVSLSGTPAIAGATVTLTLASAVLETDTDVKVSYTRPGSGTGNRLRDETGNEVASFSDRAVSTDTTAPTLSKATVDGATLTLTFNETLGAAASLVNGAFTVKKTPQGGSGQNVSLSGSPAVEGATVTLTLASAVLETDTGVKVSYTRPNSGTGNRLRDEAGNEVESFTDEPVTNIAADTTPPRLVRGEIDGGTVTLIFSEALDEASVGGVFRVTVQASATVAHEFDATGDVEVSGQRVTVGVGEGNPRTTPDVWRSNRMRYYRPTDSAAKQLRDLAGNAVEAPFVLNNEWRRTREISLDNVTGVALTVTGVEVSSDADDDVTYGLGDTIRVRLTFSKAVVVTGAPRVKLDFSSEAGDEKWADYASGSGTPILEFAYTVARGDASSAGVAVLANTLELNGGTIRSALAAGENARLAHTGLAHNAAHRVDSRPHVIGVEVSSGAGDDNTYALGETIRVMLTLSEAAAVTGAPRVKIDLGSGAGDERWAAYASGSGTAMLEFAYPVAQGDASGAGVAVLANTLELNGGTIKSTTAVEESATLAHAGLGHNPAHKVDGITPTLSVASVNGASLKIRFDEPLGAAASLVNGAFAVKKTPHGGSEETVGLSGTPAIDGVAVTLTLANAVLETDTDVKVSYTRPGSGTGNRLRDAAGNEVASFSGKSVANVTGDTTPPTLERGEIDGGTVTLYFSEALDPDSVGGYFRVNLEIVGHSWHSATAKGEVAISGNVVTVGLGARRATPGLRAQMLYTRPANPTAKQLRDLAGNPVSRTGRLKLDTISLDNVTGVALTVTGVEVSSDADDDVTYGLGDTIRVRLTFSKAVVVTGAPRVKLDFSSEAGDEKWADYASGSGTPILEFAYTVARGDASSAGVAVLANTLELNGGTIRSASAAGENARLAHTGLAHDAAHKVDGRPALSVADAQANEGSGASVSFEVSLSRAAAGAVTVDYATADGTATAGADYTATSGTLTFAAGETAKTVSVPVLDDTLNEGSETFSFRLSNATGARIADGEATGTITNDDPLQKMWLSRFGRTVAGHVTDAVSDRLSGPLTGAELTVGGQRVDLARTKDEAWLAETLTSLARALGAREEPEPEDGGGPGTGFGVRASPAASRAPARRVSGRELLLGSAFHLAAEGDGTGPGLAAWGRVTLGGFDGEERADDGSLRIDGEVTTGILGADAEWDWLLAGVAVSVSEGEGTFDQPGVDSGAIESTMTAVSPYARLALTERVSAWGLLGYGTGDMTIVQAANERGQPERVSRSDLAMHLAAVGGRGALLEAGEAGGIDLGLKADAFFVETEAEAVSNEGSTTADASRLRLILEGSRAFGLGGGSVLTPGLELGLRHDGGDAETGMGVELGGRIAWSEPGTGLGMEARVRTLLAHEDSEYREWGASGSLRLDPGASGRGLSFHLAPTWGVASSGAERLWSARDAGGLVPGAGFEPERRLEGELGYGLALFGGRFTGTPHLGFGLSDRAREYRIGWRLTRAGRGASEFEFNLDATRRESAHDNGSLSGTGFGSGAGREHGVMLRGAIRW